MNVTFSLANKYETSFVSESWISQVITVIMLGLTLRSFFSCHYWL